MKSELKSKVDHMLEVYLKIAKDYKWENNLSQHFAALTYILKDKEFEKKKILDFSQITEVILCSYYLCYCVVNMIIQKRNS